MKRTRRAASRTNGHADAPTGTPAGSRERPVLGAEHATAEGDGMMGVVRKGSAVLEPHGRTGARGLTERPKIGEIESR